MRELGFAIDIEEAGEGIVCAGAPILNSKCSPEAAISVSGLAARVSLEDLNTFGHRIRAETNRLSRQFGYDG